MAPLLYNEMVTQYYNTTIQSNGKKMYKTNIEPQKPFVPIRKLEREEQNTKFIIKDKSVIKRQESREIIAVKQSRIGKVKIKMREKSQVISISRISHKRSGITTSDINPTVNRYRNASLKTRLLREDENLEVVEFDKNGKLKSKYKLKDKTDHSSIAHESTTTI